MEHFDHDEFVKLRARLVVVHTYLRLLNVELLVNPPSQSSVVEHLHRIQNHVHEMDRLIGLMSEPVESRPIFSRN